MKDKMEKREEVGRRKGEGVFDLSLPLAIEVYHTEVHDWPQICEGVQYFHKVGWVLWGQRLWMQSSPKLHVNIHMPRRLNHFARSRLT